MIVIRKRERETWYWYTLRQDAGFAHSEEAEIAEDLLKAYDQRDQELLEKTVRLQHMTFLDNEIVKLARLLTVPGEVLSQKNFQPNLDEDEDDLR